MSVGGAVVIRTPARTIGAGDEGASAGASICPSGDVLTRKFRVDGVIGTGGMGVVIAAHHLALDKRVAIKLMRPELRARKDLVRRFLREARAAARLTSRHVTHVFDVGTLEDGAPYIVMEYLDGTDLAAWLRARGAARVSEAAAIASQAIDAIAEAHAAGIIHRDLKPANLFVTHDASGGALIKVLDLGICKLIAPIDDLTDSSAPAALGTPVYMAPEQLSVAPHADARSDIWSLGVILHELVVGRVPFGGSTLAELRVCAARDPYPAMNRADVPREFEAVVARCLAKDPADRFQRVTELAAALASFARPAHGAIPVIGPPRRVPRWTLRRIVPAMVVAVLAVSGAWLLAPSPERAPHVPAPRAEGTLPPVSPRRALDPLLASPRAPGDAAPAPRDPTSRSPSATPPSHVERAPRPALHPAPSERRPARPAPLLPVASAVRPADPLANPD